MKHILLSLILVFGLLACNWRPPSPNEPFYCKVNGKNFRPEKDNSPIGGIGSDPLRIIWEKNDGTLFINARNSPIEITVFIIFPNKEVKIGSYSLKNEANSSKGVFTPNISANKIEDINAFEGNCIIEKINGNEISGTFEFTCKSLNTGKEYKITKGCFNKLT
jgi:Family of unknown function (DUF6252)